MSKHKAADFDENNDNFIEEEFDEQDDELDDDESYFADESIEDEPVDEDYEEEDEDEDDDGEVKVIYVRDHAPPGEGRRSRGLRNLAPEPEPEVPPPPSKTKIKKQMHELRDLGAELCDLGKDQLAQLDLPENLRDAVREMQKITSFGAKRRQTQYIGKLMRDIDPAPIIAKLNAWKGYSKEHTSYMHQMERWRDRLIDDPAAMTDLLSQHPQADAQRLRTLIRNAIKERDTGKAPKSYREIFQVLKEIFPEPG